MNHAPTAPSVTITPADPELGAALTAVVTSASTDADGDPISYAYAWLLDGAVTAYTPEVVPADVVLRGQVWSVAVTPNDGTSDGPAGTAQVTIGNTSPAVVAMLPALALTDDVLTVEVTADDANGDALALAFAWRVNDLPVDGEATDALDGALHFERGDVVAVTVHVDDGQGGVAEATATTTIENSPPASPAVAITPPGPLVGRALRCIATPVPDPDGDEVTLAYAWTRNGVSYDGATSTDAANDTIAADVTAAEDVWACHVTPSDGTVDGAPGVAETAIVTWTGDRQFTSCGAIGAFGPAQAACDVAYAGSTLEGEVAVTAGIQAWTAPATGAFEIEACGAQGASGNPERVGGKGACVRSTFTLTAGDELQIAVGQLGRGQNSNLDGAGGGGSFVVRDGDQPMVIGGGGGGARLGAAVNGCAGVVTEYAVVGSGSSATSTCISVNWRIGEGGLASSFTWGSAGAGFFSDGQSDSLGHGGSAWAGGLVGGSTGLATSDGGFGGGGQGLGSYGGGGGGGYSGGGGGWIGGGGGSYNSGTNASGESGVRAGDGHVVIRLVP